MKSIMLAGAAMLAFTTGATGVALAQGMSSTASQPPGMEAAPPDQGATPAAPAMPGDADAGTAPATPATPGADPNAGQPTGTVPADTGMQPADPAVPKDSAAPVGSSANPVTVGGNMTPPPAAAKDYPVCSKTVQDSCINPGEARKARKHR